MSKSTVNVTNWAFGFAGFLGAWLVQFIYVKNRYDSERMETEASLIVCTYNSEDILNKISKEKNLANYLLEGNVKERIRDVYFDTPDGLLQKERIALRIREFYDIKEDTGAISSIEKKEKNNNGAVGYISLKGIPVHINSAYVDRPEIEKEWSENALMMIVNELKDKGIVISTINWSDRDSINPEKFLTKNNFMIVQTHNTKRERRNILAEQKLLAELDIDNVTYTFNSSEIHHYNVEIELKQNHNFKVIERIVNELNSAYKTNDNKPLFRKWNYGKFATGKGIERLLGEREQTDFFENKSLKNAAYDRIEYLIKSGLI